MAKLPIKGVPWLVVIQAAMAAREHWGVLTPRERTELARLIRATRGRTSNLTAKEQAELRRLIGRLDLPGLGKDLLPVVTRGSRKKRR